MSSPDAPTRPGEAGETSITFVRHLRARPARVWAAWTDPEQIPRWLSPPGLEVVESHGDLRPGGPWRSVMREAGKRDHVLSGEYREVVAGEKLVFTWTYGGEGESLVTVRLQPDGDGTQLTLTHERLSGDSSDVRQGWTGALDNLEAFLEGRE